MTKDDRELIERLRAKRIDGDLRTDGHLGRERIPDPDCIFAATRLEALQAQPVGEARDVHLVDDDRYTPYKSLAACDTAAIRAVRLLEDAEDHHANCSECEGEGVPELCGNCFPFFDAARVERRLVMQSLAALTASPPVVEREQPEADDIRAMLSGSAPADQYEPVLDDAGNETGYHRDKATGEVVTLGDEYDDD